MKRVIYLVIIFFWHLAVVSIQKCANKNGSQSSSGKDSYVVTPSNFTSPESAAQKLSGSVNSILTARILTARVTVSGSNTSQAPNLLSPHIEKLPITKRLFQKQTDSCDILITSCDEAEILPKCESGSAKLENCKKENGRATYTISAYNCKEIIDENGNNYNIYSGRGTISEECDQTQRTFTVSANFENLKIDIYENNQKVYEVEFSPKISISLTSSIKIEGSNAFFSASFNTSGNSREKDVKENIEQKISYENFSASLSYSFPLSGTDYSQNITDISIDFYLSYSGKYFISTSPSWCGDGGFEVSTIEPLKISIKTPSSEETSFICPDHGVLKVNNAEIRFEGNSVKITVGKDQKNYTCDEFLTSCPYPLRNAVELLPPVAE